MAKIFHAHLHGDRVTKYDRLIHSTISDTAWSEISPQTPFYLLIPQDTHLLKEYDQGWKITEIMSINSVGVLTARDALTIHWTKEEIWQTVNDFALLEPEKAREKYNLGDDARDWKVSMAQADLKQSGVLKENLVPILYRPFDVRYTYYTGKSRGFHCMPRSEVMQHMIVGNNLGLVSARSNKADGVDHFFCSEHITETKCGESTTQSCFFPLHLYVATELEKGMALTRHPNFSQPFLTDLTDRLGYTPTPEAIFYYIYAIFHSPTYRSRYAEFLKIDFPRVPLTRNAALFRQLAAYGEELVALHLMKSAKLEQKSKHPQFVEQEGKCIVEPGHPKYEVQSRSVIINKKGDRFTNVPEAVWNFYVGGYPVCAKWLKDRKGRTLSPQDIAYYQQIVVALGETITLMKAIDQAIPDFPIE
jgi:predicted helicase